jgi:tetratricopeptide (TPR) repeat protein
MRHPTPIEIETTRLAGEPDPIAAHVASCPDCMETARMIDALGDPLTWDLAALPDDPGLDATGYEGEPILREIEATERLRHADPAAAVVSCDALLRRPECRPETDGGRHLSVLVLRERANALRVLGELGAALETVARARELAGDLVVADYECAVLDYVEATVRFEREELAAATALARRAGATLDLYGDAARAGKARLLTAAVSYKRGDFDAARAQFIALLQPNDRDLGAAMTAGLLHNLADCEVRLGYHAEARAHAARAGAHYRELGMTTELVRLSWLEARMALAAGEIHRAEAAYRETEARFRDAGLELDAALVALELVELCAGEGRREEAVALATRLATVFATAGTRMSLATTLAALRDAAARGEDLTAPVSVARATIEAAQSEAGGTAFPR